MMEDLNIFMQCHRPNPAAFQDLPEGFSFRLCRENEIDIWARIVAEEKYVGYVMEFFDRVYALRLHEFFENCWFVCDLTGKPIGSCMIWRAYGKINTLGWLRVLPEYEGRGIGRALISKILQKMDFPAYLHTQPTSARAIKLYSDFGFALISDDVPGNRKNDLAESLDYLQKMLSKEDYGNLIFTNADQYFLETLANSEMAEF